MRIDYVCARAKGPITRQVLSKEHQSARTLEKRGKIDVALLEKNKNLIYEKFIAEHKMKNYKKKEDNPMQSRIGRNTEFIIRLKIIEILFAIHCQFQLESIKCVSTYDNFLYELILFWFVLAIGF